MNITIKKFLIFLFSIFLLLILILYDPRSSIIPSPFNITLMAISIAISHLIYDIEGFLGLQQVYESLNEIPHISNYYSRYYAHLGGFLLNFENIDEIKEYSNIIKEQIAHSKSLNNIDVNNLHTYHNDFGYVFFIILSFLLFGINLKSISIFFIVIVIFSAFIFMINFYKNNVYFFVLQTILFSLIIIIIFNYGGSVQMVSAINMRFLSILCVIPVLHLSLVFLDKNSLTFKSVISTFLQFFLLIFLCHVRGTALWSIMFLVLFYLIWILRIGLKNFSDNKFNVFSMITTIFLFIIVFNLSSQKIKQNLADEYKQKSVITKHMFWHSLFIGMAVSPKIHEKYVCSDIKLTDIYEVHHIPCGVYPYEYGGKPNLYKIVFYYQPRDYFGTHAAIKYLYDNKFNEQIGIINESNLEWSLNWPRYEGILKKLYFEIFVTHPIEYLYMHLIIKPLKFLLELVKSIFYFFNSFNINFIFVFLIFIASLFIQLFCIIKIKIKKDLIEIENFHYSNLIEIMFSIMILFIASLSIVFYPSPQTAISDCVLIIIVLILFYFKKKFETIN